jgi:glycosyltransferase involved in cell wall biosynthesis
MLKRLLQKLQDQKTDELFNYSVVVVDNDHTQSAKSTVFEVQKKSSIAIEYYVEPQQNISLARNKAVQNANADFVAFIDDDEFPVDNWLLNLFKTLNDFNASGVLGPVKPYFETAPPQWIIKGKLFERPSHKTGLALNWRDTRTGNVLFRKSIFNESDNFFYPEFGRTGGGDRDFFRRMIEKGKTFVWCDEALVYETVLLQRFKRTYFIKLALLRGKVSLTYPSFKPLDISKSIIAFLIYSLALPFLFLLGHHLFMKYLIKDSHHIGKLIAACGIDIINERDESR